MLDFTGLNWWAILLATGAAFALGSLWYGPLFGQTWLKALGKTAEDLQPSLVPFVISFFAALLSCVVLAVIMKGLALNTIGGSLFVGGLVGVSFIAASMASDSAFGRSGMPLFLIQSGYRVLYSILMGGILGAWA